MSNKPLNPEVPPEPGGHEPKSDLPDGLEGSVRASRLDLTMWQLLFSKNPGARILVTALLLLLVLFALAFFSDFFGGDEPNTYANDGGDAAPAASEAVDADATGPSAERGTWCGAVTTAPKERYSFCGSTVRTPAPSTC